MFAIMVVSFSDVLLRYFFNSPLTWAYDLISQYLMVALFFLALAATQRHGHNVRVDILLRNVSTRTRNAMELLGESLAAVVMAAITYLGAVKFFQSWEGGFVIAGAIPWPIWATVVFVPVGAGLLVLRLLASIAMRVLSLAYPSNKAYEISESFNIDEAI